MALHPENKAHEWGASHPRKDVLETLDLLRKGCCASYDFGTRAREIHPIMSRPRIFQSFYESVVVLITQPNPT